MLSATPVQIVVFRLPVPDGQEVLEQREPNRLPILVLSVCVASGGTLSQGFRNVASLEVIRDIDEPLRSPSRYM